MKKWIVEVGDANNISYDTDLYIFNDYESALEFGKKEFADRLENVGYDEEMIKEALEEPGADGEGNDLYEDDEGEFFVRIMSAEEVKKELD